VILFGITTATESARSARLALSCWRFRRARSTGSAPRSGVPDGQDHAMVCWLFVGSALFSGVFAILGGQALVEQWVLSLDLSPVQFMILSQAMIFILAGRWSGPRSSSSSCRSSCRCSSTSASIRCCGAFWCSSTCRRPSSRRRWRCRFYLKGVAPKHVTLNQIFAGMMPYMLIVIVCMIFMYVWRLDALAADLSLRQLDGIPELATLSYQS